MTTFLFENDPQLVEAFGSISLIEKYSDYIKEICTNIRDKSLNKENLESILKKYNKNLENIKEEILDMLLDYINFILKDNFITEKEAGNFNLLKRFFKIKEGDFYNYRYQQVKNILNKQFQIIYSDNRINSEEALLKVGLQELFGLSYDQFLEIANEEVKAALERGANLNELDTVLMKKKKPNVYKQLFVKLFMRK